jgi:hypothetical protein
MSVVSSDIFSSVTTDPVSSSSCHIVKKELFDPDMMRAILSDSAFSLIDRNRLKKYYKHRSKSNEVTVVYNFAKGYEDIKKGRVYADLGLGLQSFPKEIRNPLTAKYYWDIDIKNFFWRPILFSSFLILAP